MLERISKTKNNAERYFIKFKEGDEKGLNYFHRAYYPHYAYRAERYVKEDIVASSMAQEAFLRLWLMRHFIDSVEHLHQFLSQQIKEAGKAYYCKTIHRFYRSMLRLDGVEDYQEFMLGYEMEEEKEEDTVYLEQLEQEKQQQMERINQLLPNLNEQQQLFIRLCLRYSFNYERIAYHLGGISDYEVGLRIEQCIANLKAALTNGQKLEQLQKRKAVIMEGTLSEEQAQVLSMRYELQYSFEEIAETLQLDDQHVRRLFIQAFAIVKKAKQSA